MKVLVTGGAGFIGSHLIEYLLKEKRHVIAFDNLSWGGLDSVKKQKTNPNFKFVNLDLRNKKQLEDNIDGGIDTVFHLAANSDIMRSAKDPMIDFENTTLATFNLLEAIRKHKIKKIIYTSGSGIYGDCGKSSVSENHGPLFPVSMYGATKLSAESMIYAYSSLFGIRSYILRPANIIGSSPTHGVIYDFINKLKADSHKLIILGDGKQNKSYLYVHDFLNGLFLIWKKANKKINLFNIATDDLITVNTIARLITKQMKLTKVKISHTGGRVGWKGDIPLVKIDNTQIKALGWKNKYTTKQAVEKTIQEILDQGL